MLAWMATTAEPAPERRPPGPAERLAATSKVRAPMVLLSSEGSQSGVVDGVKVMSGMQLSDTQIVISTRGLSLALSVTSSDVTAPTRLARKVTSSALQQRWTVFRSDGEKRTGRLKFVSEDIPLAIIELTKPLEVTRECEGLEADFHERRWPWASIGLMARSASSRSR